MWKGIIYKYTSPSNKIYIGQTINEKSRKNQHHTKTIKLRTSFGEALNKYKYNNFTYVVIVRFKPTKDKAKLIRILNKLKARYINLYQSNNPDFGYNK